jgi:hypothetical protein
MTAWSCRVTIQSERPQSIDSPQPDRSCGRWTRLWPWSARLNYGREIVGTLYWPRTHAEIRYDDVIRLAIDRLTRQRTEPRHARRPLFGLTGEFVHARRDRRLLSVYELVLGLGQRNSERQGSNGGLRGPVIQEDDGPRAIRLKPFCKIRIITEPPCTP